LDDLLLGREIVLYIRGVYSGPALIAKNPGWGLAIDINHRRGLVKGSQSLLNDDCGKYREDDEG
jgi:hypothetical protein